MKELVLSKEEIESISAHLGEEISSDLKNEEKTPLLLCVMKGALNFMAELLKNIDIPVLTDYVQLSSYSGVKSTGNIVWKHTLESDIKGRTVIIVEDVVDTGITIEALKKYLNENFAPKRILVCSLFDKINARKVEAKVDYVGKTLAESKFLIGFGLDYYELERNVNYVYVPDESDLEKLDSIIEKDKR